MTNVTEGHPCPVPTRVTIPMIGVPPWTAEVVHVPQGDLLGRTCISKIVIRIEAVVLAVPMEEEVEMDRTTCRQISEGLETLILMPKLHTVTKS